MLFSLVGQYRENTGNLQINLSFFSLLSDGLLSIFYSWAWGEKCLCSWPCFFCKGYSFMVFFSLLGLLPLSFLLLTHSVCSVSHELFPTDSSIEGMLKLWDFCHSERWKVISQVSFKLYFFKWKMLSFFLYKYPSLIFSYRFQKLKGKGCQMIMCKEPIDKDSRGGGIADGRWGVGRAGESNGG